MNEKRGMLSFYTVGPNGNVGWVCSYSYRQDDRSKIMSIDLSLDMYKALVFSPDTPDDTAFAIATFIHDNSEKYGTAHCFSW